MNLITPKIFIAGMLPDAMRACIVESIDAAGTACGAAPDEILGKRRTARIARARHVAMHLVRTASNLSLMEIGEAFGGRDHGTVIHALRNVAALRAQSAEFRATLDTLQATVAAAHLQRLSSLAHRTDTAL